MAAKPEPVDPVDEELDRVLADPDVRALLDEYDAQVTKGEELSDVIPHDEARRIVGLPPRANS